MKKMKIIAGGLCKEVKIKAIHQLLIALAMLLSLLVPGMQAQVTLTYNSGNPICKSSYTATQTISPVVMGGATNPTTFHVVAGGTLQAFNTANGSFRPAGTNAGTYVVRLDTVGNTAAYATVVIEAGLATTTISYGAGPFCISGPDLSPTITGVQGGTFKVNPAMTIHPTTGVVDISTGNTGSPYTVTYVYMSPLGGCRDSSTATFSIVAAPDPSFSYPQPTYCAGTALNPRPVDGGMAPITNGNFTASPAGLSITQSTGQINLTSSRAGTYQVTNSRTANGCTVVHTKVVTLDTLVTTTISYGTGTPSFCKTGPNPAPTLSNPGVWGGTFSISPSIGIGAASGVVDLATATAGATYTVTYTFSSPSGACTQMAKDTFSVTAAPDPTFKYNKVAFCKGDVNAQAIDTSSLGNPITNGLFSSSAGLVFVSTSTGEINTTSSTAGTYIVTNTRSSNGCTVTYTVPVTIVAKPTATITYTDTLCISAADPAPALSGTSGGAFSISPDPSLINAQTGIIDMVNAKVSTTYSIKYVFSSQLGACQDSAFDTLTVIGPPDPTFQYDQTAYCVGDPNPSAKDTLNNAAITNGAFSAFPASPPFIVDTLTGELNTTKGTAGTYVITNSASSKGCVNTFSFSVTLSDTTAAGFSYPDTAYCKSASNPSPTVTVRGGTFSAFPAGLDLDSLTGVITLSNSAVNSYFVKYRSPGNCSQSDSVRIIILPTTASPKVAFTDDSICVNDAIVLNVTAPVTRLTWYNSAVEADSLSPQPANRNNPNPGDIGFTSVSPYTKPKTVYVTDSESGKCTSSFIPLTLLVGARPSVTLSASPNPVCSADSVVVSPNGADIYTLFINGVIDTVNAINNGVFRVPNLNNLDTIRVEGSRLGCSALSRKVAISVNPSPVIAFTFVDSLIVSPSASPINLNTVVNPSPGGGTGVFTTTSNGLTFSNGTYLFNPASFTNGSQIPMTYQYTTSAGCTQTKTFKIVVDSSAAVINAIQDGADVAINGRSFCNNATPFTVKADLTGLNPYDIFCELVAKDLSGMAVTPNPLTATGTTGVFTFSPANMAPGNYTFELSTRSSSDSCLSRGSVSFVIVGEPNTPTVIDPTTPYCLGAVKDTLKIANPQGGQVYYIWSDNTGVLDTVQSSSYFIGQPPLPPAPNYLKTYRVSAYRKANANVCTNGLRDSVTLQIFPIPAVPRIVRDSICTGEMPTSLVVRGMTGATYRWVSGNNTNFPPTQDTTLDISFLNNTLPDTFRFSVRQTLYDNIGINFAGCTSGKDSLDYIIYRRPDAFAPAQLPDSSLRVVCSGDTVKNLTVSNPQDTTKWWGNAGLSQLLHVGNTFQQAISQTTTYYLTRTSAQGCQGPSVPLEVRVNPLPVVSYSGLDTTYCTSDDTVSLQGGAGSPYFPNKDKILFKAIRGDSVYVPAAFFNNGLVLTNAGPGGFTIRYVYKDTLTGCVDSLAKRTSIFPSPTADFDIAGSRCLGDTLSFINSSVATPPYSLRWVILSAYTTDTVRVAIPNSGLVPVSLRVTKGTCSDSLSQTVFVGSNPNPAFTWTNSCEGDSTSFLGKAGALRLGEETIGSYSWDFGDGTPPVSVNVPDSVPLNEVRIKHVFLPGRAYTVRFSLGSKELNPSTPGFANVCRDTVAHEVLISPTVAVSSEIDYFEDFENDDGGWLRDNVIEFAAPAWQWGMPNGNVIQSPANNAWMTILRDSLQRGEQSWVLSPCFDFSGVNRPMINIDIWSNTPNGRDGAVIQSSVNDGRSWQVLGSYDNGESSGLEWYNQSTISSKPGRQTFGMGWSGQDTDWRNARHKLDQFIGKTNVRFRVAFGLDSSYQVVKRDTLIDGFAFDNVFIGERKQTLLLEHFTNTNQASSTQDLNSFYRIVAQPNNPLDVIPIQYHVAFPAPGDAINRLNPNDPEARAFQYGVTRIGRVAVNGNEFFDTRSLSQRMLNLRSLMDPLFEIDSLSARIVGDSLMASAIVTAQKFPEDIDSLDQIFVHFAVVEDSLNGGQLQSVLRKLLPDNGGQLFRRGRTWTKGSQDTLTASWFLDPAKFIDSSQLEVIVFVQDGDSNQVYQALSTKEKPNGIATHIEKTLDTPIGLTVFPNPATETFYVRMEEGLMKPATWRFTDLQGKVILEDEIPAGTRQFDVPCAQLPAGIYLIHLTTRDQRSAHKKVVIRR